MGLGSMHNPREGRFFEIFVHKLFIVFGAPNGTHGEMGAHGFRVDMVVPGVPVVPNGYPWGPIGIQADPIAQRT